MRAREVFSFDADYFNSLKDAIWIFRPEGLNYKEEKSNCENDHSNPRYGISDRE